MNARFSVSMKALLAAIALLGDGITAHAADDPAAPKGSITVRTEDYPRPPYSGATYYIYERDGKTICTKLAVCNKYGDCSTEYHAGAFKADEDVQTGQPYGSTAAVLIPPQKLAKHVCLAKYVTSTP